MDKKYLNVKCAITGSNIPQARVDFLDSMGVHPDDMTIVTVSPIQRIRIPTGKCEFGIDEGELAAEQLKEKLDA